MNSGSKEGMKLLKECYAPVSTFLQRFSIG